MENFEKTVVKGDVFIIPNTAEIFSNFSSPEWQAEKLSRLVGIKPQDDDRMVEVWITSPEVDNWQDNFAGFQKEIGLFTDENQEVEWEMENGSESRLLGYFPKYFPAKVFAGKNEGDKVTFYCPEYDVNVVLTCKQQDYRYASFGNFEDVLRSVLREG